jgi:carbonic anhydrase
MESFEKLLENNKAWAQSTSDLNPDFFKNLAKAQSPDFLWIGCSDSRVPPDKITGTMPGEIFIHRNIANLVVHTDLNLLSVLAYSVNVLKVKHIIVCGHYGCGGVKAAMGNADNGIVNKWLRNIKDVYRAKKDELDAITDEHDRFNHLTRLNTIHQLHNLSETSIVQKAWKDRNAPTLHAWIYDLNDGVIDTLHTITPQTPIDPLYRFDFE